MTWAYIPVSKVMFAANEYLRMALPIRLQILRLLALILALATAPVFADTLRGKVVRVPDGDTVTVLDAQRQQHRVRVKGIDAPEAKGQSFGQRSKENLIRLAAGRQVDVVWDMRDRYGRIVGKVLVSQEGCVGACPKVDVGLRQIEAGMAWHYKQYAADQTPEDRRRYAEAEESARAKRLGLWVDPKPVPPWTWRRQTSVNVTGGLDER